MANDIRFTDEEMGLIHLLLSRHLEATRVELRHTMSLEYREHLKNALDRDKELIAKIDHAVPSLRIPTGV